MNRLKNKRGVVWSGFFLFSLLLVGFLMVFILACEGEPSQETKKTPSLPEVGQGVNVTVDVSKPKNGSHFVAGEKAVVTLTLKDSAGKPATKDDFTTLNLYMYGPQETTKTVTAVKLLNATTDRAATPHHYIDLIKDKNVQVKGNVLTYTLQPVSSEAPGTYTVSLWVKSKEGDPMQAFKLVDVQIGTATVEKQIVEKEKCASCHLGADSKQFYFAHVDVGRSPYGNPSIDSIPVTTCKSCHNNEGYAAFTNPLTKQRVPDQIVNRVHGIHNGEELSNPINVGDPDAKTTGIFADYLHVKFPADVRNCTSCHVDDRWKTQPSRLACGACHDQIDWATGKSIVKGKSDHGGGPQANDSACLACHSDSGVKPIAQAHKVEPPPFQNIVEMALTPPSNAKFYRAGDQPKLSITIKDAASGAVINPATIVEPKDSQKVAANEWRRANLFVSGPRAGTKPVLTTAAALKEKTYTYASNDLRVRVDSKKEDPKVTRSATAITYQLDNVANLKPGTYTAFVEILPSPLVKGIGGIAFINFQVGTDKEDAPVATNCTSCHNDTRMHAAYFAVPFTPDVCKSCHDYERQMAGKSSWTDRNAGFGVAPLSRRVHGVHFGRYLDKPKEVHATYDFSEVIFPQDVRNCTKCHDATTTTGTWKTEPSRLACNACHDTDKGLGHTARMTSDPTPNDPWSGDEVEPCLGCHVPGSALAPDKVHNVSQPYVPPYPREPEK